MKQLLALLAVMMVMSTAIGQYQTYYFEKVAEVRNGKKTAASGDGHYLTITKGYLYESTNDGCDLQKGKMEYQGYSTGMYNYDGNGYLGVGLRYFFNSDYSRLNVYLCDGAILVYERKNIGNVSMLRPYLQTYGTGGYVSSPAPKSGTYSGGNNGGNRSNSSSGSNSNEVTCVYCRGAGRETVTRSINVSGYGVQNPVYTTCSECGLRYDSKATSHHHQLCGHCNGRGKQWVR